MSPITHLLASWIVAAKTTSNRRDCRLVTFAGVLPDADGLGIVVDFINNARNHTEDFPYFLKYHHWYLHGILGRSWSPAFWPASPVSAAGCCCSVCSLSISTCYAICWVRAARVPPTSGPSFISAP